MDVPGSVGWSISGDKTYEFARKPLDFIQNRILKYNSKVFSARVLNKAHIFVTSNLGIKEMLVDKGSSFDMAYKDFGYMHDLYGDIFLFNNDDEAFRLRKIVQSLFNQDNCDFYMLKIQRLTNEFLKNISESSFCHLQKNNEDSLLYLKSSKGGEHGYTHYVDTVEIYELLKKLTTAVCLSVFLDIDDMDLLDKYKEIATIHWHGLLSVPVSLKIKGWASSYNKAADAKKELMMLIKDQLTNKQDKGRFLEALEQAGFADIDDAVLHVLFFVSALIPKALSSLLTSLIIETHGESKSEFRKSVLLNQQVLDDVMLEISRLWPPLYGGRRIAKEDVTIDGYLIPKGHYVAYISRFANRDKEVFENPDHFLPERWSGKDQNKRDSVWTFGGGSRACIGTEFINRVVKYIFTYLLSKTSWKIEGVIPIYKTLPVARPGQTVNVRFSPLSSDKQEEV